MARKPRFLAPAAYRQRRLRDAARLLPILGLALLMVPLLWTEPPSGSRATLYVFAVWALLGDMNDEYGMQEFEAEGGGDTIANLLGPANAGFILATKKLHDAKEFSFGGYWNTRYRTLIDHVVVTRGMKDQIQDVKVVKSPPLAPAASDHYPVMVTIKAD